MGASKYVTANLAICRIQINYEMASIRSKQGRLPQIGASPNLVSAKAKATNYV